MVNFGKKVSTRPIVLGLLYGIFFGSIISGFSIILGLITGITAFIIVAIIYYGINLPFLFNAWSIDDQEIDYYDMSSFWKRIKLIFERSHVKHDVVHFDDITKIKVGGIKIPMHETDLFSWGVPVSPATVVYASALTRLRNPKFLLLELKDGDEVRLDMSRDFAYGSEDALDKFNQAFTILNRNLQ